MRAVLAATMVCFASTLAYCAGAEGGDTPRAEAIKANFDKLVSEDKEVKREALLYFGKVDKTFAAEVPLFTASLKDERNQVRAISAYALGKIGEAAAESIPEVEKLLADSSATVQKYANRALERLRPFRLDPENPAPPQNPGAIKPTPPEVVDAIKKLGGEIGINRYKAVVAVYFQNTKVTDAGLEHLKGLTKLETLFLHKTKVTDAGLVHLKGLNNLTGLLLTGTKVTDAGLVHLKGLTNLEELFLEKTRVSDAGLVYLKGLTKLTALQLSHNTNITDTGLAHLKGLTNLMGLFLSETGVTDAGLVHLKGLKKLTGLFLDNTDVTDAGLVHLKGLTELKNLFLNETKVTDAGLVHLKGLTKLEDLFLIQTKVTYAGVRKLQLQQQALPNCKITLTSYRSLKELSEGRNR